MVEVMVCNSGAVSVILPPGDRGSVVLLCLVKGDCFGGPVRLPSCVDMFKGVEGMIEVVQDSNDGSSGDGTRPGSVFILFQGNDVLFFLNPDRSIAMCHASCHRYGCNSSGTGLKPAQGSR
jgi:hypothetical protein